MVGSTKRFVLPMAALVALLMLVVGCDQAAIQANQQQVDAQQAQIEKLQKEIEALRAQQAYPSTPPPGTPGTCDQTVMRTASRRGGDAFSSGDLMRALGYYQDAATACPGDPQAELNLARTYEALGNREQAITHYRKAESAAGADQKTTEAARLALSRLGTPH